MSDPTVDQRAERALAVAKANGVEWLNGSFAYRGNVLPGNGVRDAMLAFAATETDAKDARIAELEAALRPFADLPDWDHLDWELAEFGENNGPVAGQGNDWLIDGALNGSPS